MNSLNFSPLSGSPKFLPAIQPGMILARALVLLAVCLLLVGCGGGGSESSSGATETTEPSESAPEPENESSSLNDELRALLAHNGVEPINVDTDDDAKIALGKSLFFDKELSGNRNISCSTCHTPDAITGDDISLSIGHGGVGRGEERSLVFNELGQAVFIPRRSPTLFFRGEMTTMFWGGRVQEHPDGSFSSPAGDDLLPGLDNALAVVEMFPVTDRLEMRGQPGENELADIADDDFHGIWTALMDRLLSISEYAFMFGQAYPDTAAQDLSFVHAANAIAAFEIAEMSNTDSPFDDYLAGHDDALNEDQKRGAVLFYGQANCVSCHSGAVFTDQSFHNRLVPQLGPGKGDGPEGLHDFGREGVTLDQKDRFAFRTPPLRNVALQKAFMHDGAFTSLEAAVEHCLDPMKSALEYDVTQLSDHYQEVYRPEQTEEIIAHAEKSEIEPIILTDEEFDLLLGFLEALTSDSLDLIDSITPDSVASGLTLED